MQNLPGGGFGGGHGQNSHLATTYAVVLALAIVGGEDAYEVIDRRAMWRWICSLKQRDGGIQMTLGGEVDVRGAYCAAVIVTLLNLPLELSTDSPAWTPERPTLFTGLADYQPQQQDAAFYRSIAHTTTTTLKARRSREAYRESRMVKHTGPTPFARWAASRFSILRIASFQSTYQSPNLSRPSSSSFSGARIDAARCPDRCIRSGPLRK
ncbi:unnamed protein product [Colletotrichum noveboracense]|uniref:Prenyltransferase alpha-alpha toroid domain-containing protein n=1 Tax=Colletotrichum noveboracense TaxID=2664923 RepID=A0A9W4S8I7_9PEZI|nr:unnamed protein product [Colletotrichum noveboracense]